MLAFVWILSAVIAFVPIYSGWNTSDGLIQNLDSSECIFAVENPAYSLTIGVGTFFIPLFILYLMYARILTISYKHVRAIRVQTYHSKQASVEEAKRQRSNSQTHTLRQHRATITLFIIVGVFTVCWLPYFILFTILPMKIVSTSVLVDDIVLWMGYLNSFANPFVYGMTNREYRTAFRKLLCSWKRPRLLTTTASQPKISNELDLICM